MCYDGERIFVVKGRKEGRQRGMTMEETRETQNQKETARLLIIEDEIPIADLLQYGLSREGFQVVCAHTAGAAISLAGSFLPQVIRL